eukprot:13783833-Alexandrium_andersonii.AAC.1
MLASQRRPLAASEGELPLTKRKRLRRPIMRSSLRYRSRWWPCRPRRGNSGRSWQPPRRTRRSPGDAHSATTASTWTVRASSASSAPETAAP